MVDMQNYEGVTLTNSGIGLQLLLIIHNWHINISINQIQGEMQCFGEKPVTGVVLHKVHTCWN